MSIREIDALHWCYEGYNDHDTCASCYGDDDRNCVLMKCSHCCRKWETPEQYKERTGKEWPDSAAVYYGFWREKSISWLSPNSYGNVKSTVVESTGFDFVIVCANTDWGCPPDDWVPTVDEEEA
jgi:hypothetical protein